MKELARTAGKIFGCRLLHWNPELDNFRVEVVIEGRPSSCQVYGPLDRRCGSRPHVFFEKLHKVKYERTAELALAKSHLEAVFHTVNEGIAVFDQTGSIIFCNDAEARIAGFASPQEMMRNLTYFAEVFELTDAAGKIVPVEQWPVSRVLRGESFNEWECHGRRKDTGQEWEFSFGGNPVKGDGGGRRYPWLSRGTLRLGRQPSGRCGRARKSSARALSWLPWARSRSTRAPVDICA